MRIALARGVLLAHPAAGSWFDIDGIRAGDYDLGMAHHLRAQSPGTLHREPHGTCWSAG